MSAPLDPPTGSLLMQRTWIYEFNTATGGGAAVWAVCEGVTNTQFMPSAGVWTDSTDQSGKGKTSVVKTGDTFTGSITINEATNPADPTIHAAVQDLLRTAGEATGPANVLQFRVSEYDFNDPNGLASPRVYAYVGKAGIDYAPSAAIVNEKRTAVITLHPDSSGTLARVAHPYPAGTAVPTVGGVTSPLAVAGGTLAKITGTGFTGVTALSIAGTTVPAGDFSVVDSHTIYATAPAHAAGSALPVVVTNATGPSTGGATVTYA